MNGMDLLIDVACISLLVGALWFSRWQGQQDKIRQQRLERRGADFAGRINNHYGYRKAA